MLHAVFLIAPAAQAAPAGLLWYYVGGGVVSTGMAAGAGAYYYWQPIPQSGTPNMNRSDLAETLETQQQQVTSFANTVLVSAIDNAELISRFNTDQQACLSVSISAFKDTDNRANEAVTQLEGITNTLHLVAKNTGNNTEKLRELLHDTVIAKNNAMLETENTQLHKVINDLDTTQDNIAATLAPVASELTQMLNFWSVPENRELILENQKLRKINADLKQALEEQNSPSHKPS